MALRNAQSIGIDRYFATGATDVPPYTQPISTDQVTVGLAPVQVVATPLPRRKTLMLHNPGTNPIYYGFDNTITTATGLLLRPHEYRRLDLGDEVDLWAVAGVAGQTLEVLEMG